MAAEPRAAAAADLPEDLLVGAAAAAVLTLTAVSDLSGFCFSAAGPADFLRAGFCSDAASTAGSALLGTPADTAVLLEARRWPFGPDSGTGAGIAVGLLLCCCDVLALWQAAGPWTFCRYL